MAKKKNVKVRAFDGAVWAFETPSLSQLPEAPLHEALLWILEQINLGNFRIEPDSCQRNVSLIVGFAAAPSSSETTVELEADHVRERLLAVNIAGLFSRSREQGVEPKWDALVDKASATMTHAGYFNTDLHYAFELVDVLKRIREKTFVFSAPPIMGKASADVVLLLREATRSYLFGLSRASVALCRACVERLLKDRLNRTDVLQEAMRSNTGEFDALIRVASSTRLLNEEMADWAQALRKIGNRALHSRGPTDEEAWQALVRTRGIAAFIHR